MKPVHQFMLVLAITALTAPTAWAQSDASAASAPSSSGNFLTGGAKITLLKQEGSLSVLPKPNQVLIRDLTIAGSDVVVDQSLAAKLRRHRLLREGKDDDSTPEILADHVQAEFSTALALELEKINIQAVKDRAGAGTTDAAHLLVEGQFTVIDEGNKSKRMMFGFGSGASDITVHITVALIADKQTTEVLAFEMSSQSGKGPGAVVSGGGSLAVSTAVSDVGDNLGASVEADAERMAKLAAKQIAALMAEPHWRVPATSQTASGAVASAAGAQVSKQ